jgi:hypothetical protein
MLMPLFRKHCRVARQRANDIGEQEFDGRHLISDVIAAEARPASIDGTVDVVRPAADR